MDWQIACSIFLTCFYPFKVNVFELSCLVDSPNLVPFLSKEKTIKIGFFISLNLSEILFTYLTKVLDEDPVYQTARYCSKKHSIKVEKILKDSQDSIVSPSS